MPYLSLPFARKTWIVNATKFWTTLALIFALLALDVVWLVVRAKTLNFRIFVVTPPLKAVISLLIILAIVVLFIWFMVKVDERLDARMEKCLANYEHARKGDDGEILVRKYLNQYLDEKQYKIYPNYKIPAVKADYDFVVVGPKGVILIEVKTYDVHTVFTYDKAYGQSADGKLFSLWDIREKVKWRAGQLERYLAEHGLDNINVRKVVLFVNLKSVEIQGGWKNKYKVYVAQGIPAFADYLFRQQPSPQFTPEYVKRVCDAFNIQTTPAV